ncbi:hypothetical protein QJS04_geneDACA020213 [Acorus gramineus]|uniref:Uncharacterized protein n=1 Tax=Acorus gramineus TaxID=55184 RepID=A0AAV9BKI4_ACOGR|nr:hypothetical protein QJS04_geneDACA020213 [Acorus gramineus]
MKILTKQVKQDLEPVDLEKIVAFPNFEAHDPLFDEDKNSKSSSDEKANDDEEEFDLGIKDDLTLCSLFGSDFSPLAHVKSGNEESQAPNHPPLLPTPSLKAPLMGNSTAPPPKNGSTIPLQDARSSNASPIAKVAATLVHKEAPANKSIPSSSNEEPSAKVDASPAHHGVPAATKAPINASFNPHQDRQKRNNPFCPHLVQNTQPVKENGKEVQGHQHNPKGVLQEAPTEIFKEVPTKSEEGLSVVLPRTDPCQEALPQKVSTFDLGARRRGSVGCETPIGAVGPQLVGFSSKTRRGLLDEHDITRIEKDVHKSLTYDLTDMEMKDVCTFHNGDEFDLIQSDDFFKATKKSKSS